MGYENGGLLWPFDQGPQLQPHRLTQFGIEVGEGSSRSSTSGSTAKARGYGDALLLAAAQL